jgi:hypothetical protein
VPIRAPLAQIHLRNGHNLVLCTDKELGAKSEELGFNLSKTFENHLRHLITQSSTSVNVRFRKMAKAFNLIGPQYFLSSFFGSGIR